MSNEEQQEIKISSFLSEDRILILHGRQNKEDVLNALIDLFAKVPDIGARDDIAWGIFHREGLMTTGIGNGIAVPHFRLPALDESYLAIAVCPDGIRDYHTPDGQIVKLVFMIIAGKKQKTLHVQMVARIAKTFFDGRLKAAFLACSEPENCMKILLHEEEA